MQGARAEIGEGATVVNRAAADRVRVAAVEGAGPRAVERVASGGTMAGGIGLGRMDARGSGERHTLGIF